MDYKQQFSVDTGDPLNGTLEQKALFFHIYNKSAALQEWTEFAKNLWGEQTLFFAFHFVDISMFTQP